MPDQIDPQEGRHRVPRHRWSYERGEAAFDRVAYFTDAVFAIAMTLLIVSVEAPELKGGLADDRGAMLDALSDSFPQLFSFFLAFLLLARYWMAHHAFFAVLGRIDRRFIALNLTYLAFVAFLPFPTELVGKYEHNPIGVVLFALTLAAISGMESVLFRHAHREQLLRHPMSERTYRYGMIQSTTPVVLFLLSIPIALWSPTAALLSWLLAMPIGLIVDRRQRAEERRDRPGEREPERDPLAPPS
jgi:uncharacterized membrane protein